MVQKYGGIRIHYEVEIDDVRKRSLKRRKKIGALKWPRTKKDWMSENGTMCFLFLIPSTYKNTQRSYHHGQTLGLERL